jgi:putative oxidoreductase
MSTLAENFNLANEFNILRIICGLFFIPHMIGKYSEREFTMGFFKNAGLNPPGPSSISRWPSRR